MSQLPSANDLIHVALIPSARDLEIARVLGWYRIPLRSASKVVAPVKGHELVTRAELINEEADQSRSSEEYFKLPLGEVISLPRQIPSANGSAHFSLYHRRAPAGGQNPD